MKFTFLISDISHLFLKIEANKSIKEYYSFHIEMAPSKKSNKTLNFLTLTQKGEILDKLSKGVKQSVKS